MRLNLDKMHKEFDVKARLHYLVRLSKETESHNSQVAKKSYKGSLNCTHSVIYLTLNLT